jgi:hypothetical protein
LNPRSKLACHRKRYAQRQGNSIPSPHILFFITELRPQYLSRVERKPAPQL